MQPGQLARQQRQVLPGAMGAVAVGYFFLLAFVAMLPSSASAAERQRSILAESSERPRFELRDRDWPGNVGEASICLWKDDALAACSITIDDNTAPDHVWWHEMSKNVGPHRHSSG